MKSDEDIFDAETTDGEEDENMLEETFEERSGLLHNEANAPSGLANLSSPDQAILRQMSIPGQIIAKSKSNMPPILPRASYSSHEQSLLSPHQPEMLSFVSITFVVACLDESLRLAPPTVFGLMRKTPPEGAPVMGYFVPSNTAVSMTAYGAHRDPVVFPDPEAFEPERWLSERGKDLQPYFIAFCWSIRCDEVHDVAIAQAIAISLLA